MPDDFVAIDIQNLPSLLDQLDAITDPGMRDGLNDVADYLRGVLRNQPDYRHVSRKEAFGGDGFFSDKQRRWFFAALDSGELSLPYQRTGALRDGWQIAGKDSLTPMLFNSAPHAIFAHDAKRQSRMLKKIGWKTLADVVKERSSQIARVMAEAVRKSMKKRK